MAGTLYIVSTPIGNMKDITLRAIEVLKEVDLLCVEDTRVTRRLLDVHGVGQKPTWSFHEHNEKDRCDAVLAKLEDGEDVALVSDAGTPIISDPGFTLIRRVAETGGAIEVVPGPCAAVSALVASGLPPEPFTYVGFPPKKESRAKRWIEERLRPPGTFIVYIPARDAETFAGWIGERWPNAPVVLARELTKIHETYHRATASTFSLETEACRGEATLVVYLTDDEDESATKRALKTDLEALLKAGLHQKDAIVAIANLRSVSKSSVKAVAADLEAEVTDD